MPQLDVLRGLAITLVVVYHGIYWTEHRQPGHAANAITWLTQYGAMGVNLFFVLSGFLITGILIDTKNSTRYFSGFYMRRALRILPAYLLTIVGLILLGMISRGGVLASLTFLANYSFIPAAQKYGPLWSLSVEEQFYLVWPLIVMMCSRRALVWVAAVICLGEPLARGLVTFWIGPHEPLVHGATFLIGDHFAWGALAAILVRSRYGTRKNALAASAAMAGVAAAILLGGVPFGLLHGKSVLEATLQAEPFELTFTAMILGSLAMGGSMVAGPVFLPLRWLGEVSYGLYLVHMIVFTEYDRWSGREGTFYGHFGDLLVRMLVCGVAAAGIAWGSRRFYEERFLRMKNRIAPRAGRPLSRSYDARSQSTAG